MLDSNGFLKNHHKNNKTPIPVMQFRQINLDNKKTRLI